MSLVTTQAILLRAFPYSESSTILRFYTRDLGVVGVMARGARSRQSRGQGGLDTFAQGDLTLYHRSNRDLQTLREFTPVSPRRELATDLVRFGAASVLGEVVLRHAGEEGNSDLFHRLSGALDRLAQPSGADAVGGFLAEGWCLVEALGYRPELAACVTCGRLLTRDEVGRFDFSAGGIRCAECGGDAGGPRIGAGARAQLEALLDGQVPAPLTRPRAHVKLLSDFVTYHVSEGRPLQSFGFFFDLLQGSHA
jgi:DNA repair protein RecO (recombination protein O)